MMAYTIKHEHHEAPAAGRFGEKHASHRSHQPTPDPDAFTACYCMGSAPKDRVKGTDPLDLIA